MLIHICDICWACRHSVKQVVRRRFEKVEIKETSSLEQMIDQADLPSTIDLVIVDPFAEGGDWPRRLARLSNRLPDVPIAIFAMSTNRREILRAIECGAKGYIHKSADGEAIAEALARIMKGEIYLSGEAFGPAEKSETVRPRDRHKFTDAAHRRNVRLSNREIELLELLAQGVTNAGMADQLGLSVNTVRVYISGILKKLGLGDRTQAALFAVKMLADGEN